MIRLREEMQIEKLTMLMKEICHKAAHTVADRKK
jgi:hypothetical protein